MGVIFTAPDLNFIDAQTRKLFHAYIECLMIDYEKQQVIAKYMEIQNNPRFGKEYFKYPRIRVGNEIIVVNRILINKPSEKLIEDYEVKKREFTRNLKIEVEKSLKKEREVKEMYTFSLDEVVEDALKNLNSLISRYKGRTFIDPDLIRAKYNVGIHRAKMIKKVLEKRVNLSEIKQNT
ncbi:MAG: hypothetical protein QW228_03030 [Candidatus Aenigmatarchaeota archaeon]